MIDRDLRYDILDELDYEPGIDATGIDVSVEEGTVTLRGSVPSYCAKLAARDLVEAMRGVRVLSDHLQVLLPDHAHIPDAILAERARAVLDWSAQCDTQQISISVSQGCITLEGEVNWSFEARAAERAVRDLVGVTGVNNNLGITPRIRPEDVSERIRRRLLRDAEFEAADIRVAIEGSTVTLEGCVRHLSDRRSAERAAWAAPGVSEVVDRLVVR
jgi:osmotically-inducible protein OsmY